MRAPEMPNIVRPDRQFQPPLLPPPDPIQVLRVGVARAAPPKSTRAHYRRWYIPPRNWELQRLRAGTFPYRPSSDASDSDSEQAICPGTSPQFHPQTPRAARASDRCEPAQNFSCNLVLPSSTP